MTQSTLLSSLGLDSPAQIHCSELKCQVRQGEMWFFRSRTLQAENSLLSKTSLSAIGACCSCGVLQGRAGLAAAAARAENPTER